MERIADTSALIGLSRKDVDLMRVFGRGDYGITFITLAELALGILKSNNPQMSSARIEPWIRGRQVLYPSQATPVHYAEVCHGLERRGLRIPVNDMWIAAIAMENDLPLVGRDEHFSRVNGLVFIPC